MGFKKVDIITGTLKKQADKYTSLATCARREVHEHKGAAQALRLLAQQMPSFASEIEKRVEADEDMSSDTAQMVRVYIKNIVARFQTMCESNSKNQSNQGLICEGRAQAAEQIINGFLKDMQVEMAVAARRAEEEAAEEAAEIVEKLTSKTEEDKDTSDAKAIEVEARAALEAKKKASPRKKRPSKKN